MSGMQIQSICTVAKRSLLAMLLIACALPVQAVERLSFSIESMSGDGWRAEGIQWALGLSAAADSYVEIAQLLLPAPYGEIHKIRIDCRKLEVEAGLLACTHGRATAKADWLSSSAFDVNFHYRPGTQAVELKIAGMPAFGGQLDLTAGNSADWKFHIKARQLVAEQFSPWLTALLAPLKGWQFAGLLDADIQGTERGARFTIDMAALNFSDAESRYASEGLGLRFEGEVRRQTDGWHGQVSTDATGGQLYVEPVFVDFSSFPAQLTANIRYDAGGSAAAEFELQDLKLTQKKVLQLEASGLWAADKWQRLNATVQKAKMASGYGLYAKPFLLGTALESLQAAGEIDLQIWLESAEIRQLSASLRGVVLEDNKGRFAWDGIDGELNWSQNAAAKPSNLRWAGGAAYKVLLGPAQMQVQARGREVLLSKPLTLPLLEGALVVKQFAAQGLGAEDMAIQFDGELTPLNLEALTTALGWPRFGGKLAGRLPDLDYRSGALTLGGALQAEVFDGKVQIENLRVQDPFGRLPQLFADVRMRSLDLEAVTQAFSFGLIEGRLDGDVEQLQMLNWKPVAFNARLATPENDESRHRISQRAIENISAIGGGGAGAVLSRGFLRFFDSFAYDRIGLSCRLARGVCLMGGVGPSSDGNGYVLVKGRLLPRIDVTGYAKEVDWATLVEQLKTVTKGEGPVVR